jgi:hypothetical protein
MLGPFTKKTSILYIHERWGHVQSIAIGDRLSDLPWDMHFFIINSDNNSVLNFAVRPKLDLITCRLKEKQGLVQEQCWAPEPKTTSPIEAGRNWVRRVSGLGWEWREEDMEQYIT